jgi:multiple sugar transport system permease protein
MTAVGITWSLLTDQTIGLIPYFLKIIGIERATFFRDPSTAMATVIAMTIWKNFGYTMSILVVGIQSISKNYFEASEIDGASKVQQFFYITIPCLLPYLGFCLITNLIGSLQVFDQVFVTTQGGPQYKTETLVYYIYKMGFSQPFDLGYASAMSVLMLIIILTLSFPLYKKFFMQPK